MLYHLLTHGKSVQLFLKTDLLLLAAWMCIIIVVICEQWVSQETHNTLLYLW